MNKNDTYDLKKKRPNVLLVGNGLLRPSGKEFSWSEIIKKMSKDGCKSEDFNMIPYTIQATVVAEPDDNKRHDKYVKAFKNYPYERKESIVRLLDLPFDSILTTNYTYELEEHLMNGYAGFSENKKRKYSTTTARRAESKYLLRTNNEISSIKNIRQKIWHIHGELRNKSSMILTHDEYARLSSRILYYIAERGNEYSKFYDNLCFKSWIDYLIMGNVFIVGQGFDYAEFDLWWLLSRRVREKATVGNIIYYEANYEDKAKQENLERKFKVLKELNVECRTLDYKIVNVSDSANYANFYDRVIDDINTELKKRGKNNASIQM